MKQLIHGATYNSSRVDVEHPSQRPDRLVISHSFHVRPAASPFRHENVTLADILGFLYFGAFATVRHVWDNDTAASSDS